MLEPGVGSSGSNNSDGDGDNNDGMRRPAASSDITAQDGLELKKAAEVKILLYYQSLTQGCGDPTCDSDNCVSSGKVATLTGNEAAVRALQLLSARAPLCRVHRESTRTTATDPPCVTTAPSTAGTASSPAASAPSTAAPTPSTAAPTPSTTAPIPSTAASSTTLPLADANKLLVPNTLSSTTTVSPPDALVKNIAGSNMEVSSGSGLQTTVKMASAASQSSGEGGLTYDLLSFTLEQCRSEENFAKMRRLLWSVFSNEMALKNSYLKKQCTLPSPVPDKRCVQDEASKILPAGHEAMHVDPTTSTSDTPALVSCKEQMRATESDLDKDIDSAAEECNMSCDEATNPPPTENLCAGTSFVEPIEVDCAPNTSSVSSSSLAQDNIGVNISGSIVASSSGGVNEVIAAEERTIANSEKDTKVLGLPMADDEAGKTSAIGYTVLKSDFPSPLVDYENLHRSYKLLMDIPEAECMKVLLNAQVQLIRDNLSVKFKSNNVEIKKDPLIVHILVLLLENPMFISDNDYTETLLEPLSELLTLLGEQQRAILVVYLAKTWTKERLHSLLAAFHHLITIKLITTESGIGAQYDSVQYERTICYASKAQHLVFMASILAGEVDLPLLRDMPPPGPLGGGMTKAKTTFIPKVPDFDDLCKVLGIHHLDSKKPLIPFSEFYHEFLSEQLEVDKDYAFYKSGADKFSFLYHPYILTPASKALALYYDNRIRMYSERRLSAFQTLTDGLPATPYLRLRVRRDHLIHDALVELELNAQESPTELRKQLVVEFAGEQGIDEGGVSKEFFQLVTEKLFCADFGMFCVQQDTGLVWFNPRSFESEAQFSLVGLVLGLAIYNNVILDLRLPSVLYKKLCGKPGTFQDLELLSPTVHRSLVSMMEYEDDDMEDVFVQNFRVGYHDVFGDYFFHNLKEDGDNIMVGQHNKHEFVSLYSDWLLNGMVEQQFGPFLRGFLMVTEESPLTKLFRPDELELLLCGSPEYDFSELQKSAEYDAGYSPVDPVIIWFWEIVKAMSADDQKQLLQFTTGSARAPVGGLAYLKLVIARHGPDTDRLPTAHTCFNVLLLPAYSSKEKLQNQLLKAIKYSHGFGML